VSRRRLLVLLTLITCGVLAVALPVSADYKPGQCHVMQAAGTKGTLGPNLDRDHVSYTNVVNAVVQGVGGIQAEYLLRVMKFQQLYDVAKFVTTQRR
jgi:hypothetical protein